MKYFSISELIKSDTAIKKRVWNGASAEEEANLTALVAVILDPLREAYGKPINITSGYRNATVNKLVGGVIGSQHMKGEAADIDTGRRSENRKLMRMIVDMGLPFDQLIDENGYRWVHVSYKRKGNNRGQILRLENKAYKGINKEDI